MKRTILILLVAILLSGCFRQNLDDCPQEMRLSFYLDDEYEPGDYDSRIGNEVLLYIFQDGILTETRLIPYDKISGGKECVIRKTKATYGNLDLVAWAVPAGAEPGLKPQYAKGDGIDNLFLELDAYTRAGDDCRPSTCERYLGSISSVEELNEPSSHRIEMGLCACRVIVNVSDPTQILSTPGSEPRICLHGSKTRMDLQRKGIGNNAIVHSLLHCSDDPKSYSTGRFGIMPSAEDQAVSIMIFNADAMLASLTIPRDNLPQGAQSGGLLIFDYVLGEASFNLTIDGFTEKIVIIDEI